MATGAGFNFLGEMAVDGEGSRERGGWRPASSEAMRVWQRGRCG